MATKKYRVLTDTHIEGLPYRCNEVVVLDRDLGVTHTTGEGAALDGASAAVQYCETELGAVAIDHAARKAAGAPAETVETPPAS